MKRVRRSIRTGARSMGRYPLYAAAPKFLLPGLLVCALVCVGACAQADIKPQNITENDVCFRCKAAIVDKHYAAELVTKDGFVRKFDDIGCMIQYAKEKIGKGNVAAYYATDFPSVQWVKADDAFFVKSDKFQTPAGGGILAFKDQAKAQALASQYQAQLVPFKDLIQ